MFGFTYQVHLEAGQTNWKSWAMISLLRFWGFISPWCVWDLRYSVITDLRKLFELAWVFYCSDSAFFTHIIYFWKPKEGLSSSFQSFRIMHLCSSRNFLDSSWFLLGRRADCITSNFFVQTAFSDKNVWTICSALCPCFLDYIARYIFTDLI